MKPACSVPGVAAKPEAPQTEWSLVEELEELADLQPEEQGQVASQEGSPLQEPPELLELTVRADPELAERECHLFESDCLE